MSAITYSTIEEMGDDHYDVGITGMWYGENYGSVLTYFALQKTLRDMGYTVLMVQKPVPVDDPELNPNTHAQKFAREHHQAIAPRLDKADLRLLNEHCDTFVVGSDQVWNYAIARHAEEMFYLTFAGQNNRKVSYAASFGWGKSFVPPERASDVTRYYNDFDAISIREDVGVRVIMNEFGYQATQVLDPVFLQEASVYRKIKRTEDCPNDDYLLAYILDPTAKVGKILKSQAKARGLRVVAMLDGRGYVKDADYLENSKRKLGIEEAIICKDVPQWLALIDGASYVVTDSFHGSCFALLFEKPFVSLVNKQRGPSRFYSFARVFGLIKCIAHNERELDTILSSNNEIDYDCVHAILDFEKSRSQKWLAHAMSKDLRSMPDVSALDHKECCGCGSCYNSCPVGAIRMEADREGFLYPVIDHDACVSCGRCVKACPSLNTKRDNWKIPVMFAAYTDDPVRESSSSGGIFSLVADRVLEDGGAVCGAAFDDKWNLRHVVIESKDDLEPLRMSKYMQSDTAKTYTEIKQILDEGRPALYVGCGCQVAGLRSYLGKDYPKLVTMDLLCHGGPSQKVFQKYLSEVHHGRKVTHVGFRDKDTFGWSTEMTVKYADGNDYRALRSEDLFYRAFLPCLSARPHCQVCRYSSLPRQGDLTLGDFWGVQRYNREYTDGRGTSLISVNNRHGLSVLNDIEKSLKVLGGVNLEHVLTHGQPLARPFSNNVKRQRFFRLIEDVTMERAVTCCEKDDFDFGIIGAHADTPFDILSTYALYKFLARNNNAVLIAHNPYDFEHTIEHWRHQFYRFGNRHFPTISTNDLLSNYSSLNKTCRRFVSEGEIREEVLTRLSPADAALSLEKTNQIPAPLLVTGDVYRQLLLPGETDKTSYVRLALYHSKDSTEIAESLAQLGVRLESMPVDCEVEEVLALTDSASLVVTDDERCAWTCIALDTPVLYVTSDVSTRQRFALFGLESCLQADNERLADAVNRVLSEQPPQSQIDASLVNQGSAELLRRLNDLPETEAPQTTKQVKPNKTSVKKKRQKSANQLDKENRRLQKRIDQIEKSKSYRLGRALTKPLRAVKSKLKGK